MGRVTRSAVLVGVVFSLAGVAAAQPVPDQLPANTKKLPTIVAKSKIVVIDVVVTDAHGLPVKGLKASDFTLKEDGAAQTLNYFEAFTALPPADAGKLQELPKLEPNIFTNLTPVPEGALNVLLFDALNTPPEDQMFMRAELLKYLKSARPGTRMAIFGLSSELKLLQGFTSDPAVLKAVLENGKNGPITTRLTDNSNVAAARQGSDQFTSFTDSIANDSSFAVVAADVRAMDDTMKSYQEGARIRLTLNAMDNVARYLSGLPGRKNLLWFSASFPVNIQPHSGSHMPGATFDGTESYENEFHTVVSALMRSQVAVYPIDGRGLRLGLPANTQDTASLPLVAAAAISDQKKFFDDTAADHATMKEMANETGGMAFINTNGLTAAVKQAIEEGSNYYTLTYTPSNRNFHGDLRKVQVQLADAGLKLSYRRGYYADDLEAPAPTAIEISDAPNRLDPRGSAMQAAMQFGGPDPTEIIFKAAINPIAGEPEVAVARGNRLEPQASGPFKRYLVYIAVLPTDLRITALPHGMHRLRVELETRVYNANGELQTSATTQVRGDIDDARYSVLMRGGLQFRQEISIPLKGQAFLRVGVHDLVAEHVGAIEVPVSTLAKLRPVADTIPAK